MATSRDTERTLADAVGRLSEVAERLAEVTAARAPELDGAPALTRRMRHAQNAKVLGALVVGALVAAMVVPSHKGGGDSSAVSTGDSASTLATGDAGTPSDVGSPSLGGGTVGGGAAVDPSTSGGSSTGSPSTVAPGSSSAGGSGPMPGAAAPSSSGPVRGVTDKEITIGVVDLDSSDLAPVCPRCGNGPSRDGFAVYGLLNALRRDGKLPVHGRDIKIERRQTKVLDVGQRRAACVELAQQVKAFAVLVNPVGTFDVAQCLAKEFKQQTFSFDAPAEQVLAQTPTLWSPHATLERILRNYVYWAHERGLFKGQTLGLYCCDGENAVQQETVNRSLKPALAQLGYKLAVEVKSDGQQSSPLAVQRFRVAGVTTAIVLTDVIGFQQAAKAQGYHPKYPMPDTGYNFTDAVADITFDTEQMDGNYGMRVKWWQWSQRKPPKAIGNAAAQYCVDAYQAETKRTLDVFDNGAELEYTIESCALVQVLMQALELAGPDLTPQTFQSAMTRVRGMQNASFLSGTFTASRRSGADLYATYQFRKSRWQPTNEYFGLVAPWQRFKVD